jgi:hypothetical protein
MKKLNVIFTDPAAAEYNLLLQVASRMAKAGFTVVTSVLVLQKLLENE